MDPTTLEKADENPSISSCLTLFLSFLPVLREIPLYILFGTGWKIFYVASLDVLHDQLQTLLARVEDWKGSRIVTEFTEHRLDQ